MNFLIKIGIGTVKLCCRIPFVGIRFCTDLLNPLKMIITMIVLYRRLRVWLAVRINDREAFDSLVRELKSVLYALFCLLTTTVLFYFAVRLGQTKVGPAFAFIIPIYFLDLSQRQYMYTRSEMRTIQLSLGIFFFAIMWGADMPTASSNPFDWISMDLSMLWGVLGASIFGGCHFTPVCRSIVKLREKLDEHLTKDRRPEALEFH